MLYIYRFQKLLWRYIDGSRIESPQHTNVYTQNILTLNYSKIDGHVGIQLIIWLDEYNNLGNHELFEEVTTQFVWSFMRNVLN